MRKLSVLLLALAGLFVLTGCSDSPKDVAVKYSEALLDGNIKKANEYSTEKTHAMNGMVISMLSSDSEDAKKTKAEFKANLSLIKKAKEEIDGDTAKLIIEGEEGKPMILKKVDGKWKVDAQK